MVPVVDRPSTLVAWAGLALMLTVVGGEVAVRVVVREPETDGGALGPEEGKEGGDKVG
jgi:hypothetical protein